MVELTVEREVMMEARTIGEFELEEATDKKEEMLTNTWGRKGDDEDSQMLRERRTTKRSRRSEDP